MFSHSLSLSLSCNNASTKPCKRPQCVFRVSSIFQRRISRGSNDLQSTSIPIPLPRFPPHISSLLHRILAHARCTSQLATRIYPALDPPYHRDQHDAEKMQRISGNYGRAALSEITSAISFATPKNEKIYFSSSRTNKRQIFFVLNAIIFRGY